VQQPTRWVNRNHPQTLYIATILLYIDAVFAVLGGAIGSGYGLLIALGSVVAGLGIANDKRAGWYLGIAVSAIIPFFLARHLWVNGLDELLNLDFLLLAIFPIAQLTALVHPMSRSYTRVYFE
jgi:hypothetical protein